VHSRRRLEAVTQIDGAVLAELDGVQRHQRHVHEPAGPSARPECAISSDRLNAVSARGGGMARAQAHARGGPTAAATPSRRLRATGGRRVSKKPSVIRRVGHAVWVAPRHAALALTTGLACGAVAARIDGLISAPYAAILGTLAGYPALVAVWRRLPRSGSRR
jgi:hypothetical protein